MIPPLRLFRFALAGSLLLAVAISLAAQEKKGKEPCTLIVTLPAKAKLLIDDKETYKEGSERKFKTPLLEPGATYYYVLTATWEPNNYTRITRKRKVDIKAGTTVTVDLTRREKELDEIKIRYVPTPPEVVSLMCKLGKVGKEDVVYDLGCGDGRIVIAAVKDFAAKKGVGVDIDPDRIKDSKANAEKNKAANLVEFREGDVFKVKDLENASVVMLYMSNELNEQLRPILLSRLKPGSRVVSHRFMMGDWKPDRTEVLEVGGEEYRVHLWIIPETKEEKKPMEDKKPMEEKKPKDTGKPKVPMKDKSEK